MSIIRRPARSVDSSLPWQLTDAAVEDWCDITRRDPEDAAVFERAKAQLADRLRNPLRFKSHLDSGCQLWRLTEKPRVYLVVDQRTGKVTAVRPEHGRSRPKETR